MTMKILIKCKKLIKSWNFRRKVYYYEKLTFSKKSVKKFKNIDGTTKIWIKCEKMIKNLEILEKFVTIK